ncbi:general transcription factor 3C polypeptide 5 [Anopheles cruzii]|uniref:general transcription factor 3C polypeptide 5 n=1 Tax=Anopheles cruzii TaxID=68878 RepID=UPI0022EC62BF|nr:general transcription factor 3C polypeptide 5 [Anopheles cruzii]
MEKLPKSSKGHRFDNSLICIEYPGAISNVDRMLHTLGGLREISTTFEQDKRRIELRFRPDCMFAKPTYADGAGATGLALKVVVRRKKTNPDEAVIKSTKIIGCVRRIYKFNAMCDFQQLPVYRNAESRKVECLHDEIVPKGVCTTSPLDRKTEIPFFLPPTCFSRTDVVNFSVLREKKLTDSEIPAERKSRLLRQKYGIYHPYTMTEPIPAQSNKKYQEMLATRMIPKKNIEDIQAAFDARPIWTKSALRNINRFDISHDTISTILPAVGFYYVNGPWRGTWVRYGYDPRKHFEARMYQLLDFRVRSIDALHESIKIKRRATGKLNYRIGGMQVPKDEQPTYENSIFTEDTVPHHRIIFYQYCDIHLKKIKEMLNKVPSPMSGTVCDERNGWLPNRFDDQCRNIMMEVVLNNIRKLRASNPEAYEEMDSVSEDADGLADLSEVDDEPLSDASMGSVDELN